MCSTDRRRTQLRKDPIITRLASTKARIKVTSKSPKVFQSSLLMIFSRDLIIVNF